MWKVVLVVSYFVVIISYCFYRQFNEVYLKIVGKIKLEIIRLIFYYF